MKACLLCSSMEPRCLFDKNGFRVVRCNSCHVAWVADTIDRETMRQHYSWDYFHGDLGKFGYLDYGAEHANRVHGFQGKKRYIQERFTCGLLLDVGCADGSFLSLFQEPWQVSGVELSNEIVERLPDTRRMRIYQGFFEEYPGVSDSFDVITMWDLIDHVENPVATIQKVKTLLKPGGLLGLNTGDMDSLVARLLGKNWYLYIPPTHLTFFSRASLTRLLEKEGFQVEQVTYEGKPVSLRLAFFRLRYIFPWTWWAKAMEKIWGWIPESWGLTVNFWDVMTVWARKP